jgi:hypothetical protein
VSKTKVKKDKHGLYVRAGGYVFRPVLSRDSYSLSHNSRANSKEEGVSVFAEGAKVHARHRSQTTWGTVRDDVVEELWHAHGSYYDDLARVIPSEDCWQPAKEHR